MDGRRRRTTNDGYATPGILTLARVLRRHWHAVQRDLLTLGYHKRDIFTTLTVGEMVAIVVAAPPNTAIYHAVNGGWTITDHLLATMGEQQAGLIQLQNRHLRPGVTDIRPAKPASVHDHSKPVQHIAFDTMTVDEFEKRRAERKKRKGA